MKCSITDEWRAIQSPKLTKMLPIHKMCRVRSLFTWKVKDQSLKVKVSCTWQIHVLSCYQADTLSGNNLLGYDCGHQEPDHPLWYYTLITLLDVHAASPSPPVDNIRVMMIVWREGTLSEQLCAGLCDTMFTVCSTLIWAVLTDPTDWVCNIGTLLLCVEAVA